MAQPFPALSMSSHRTNIFHLPAFPKRIVIQGGGYIALEFACIFAGLGADVTLVYRGDNILRGFDEDVRQHVRGEVERAGIAVLTGCTVNKVGKHGEASPRICRGVQHRGRQGAVCHRPSSERPGLGLEKAGVALNPANGGIAVDGFSQSNVPHIYAVGDVTHRINLTPVAIREGHAFADTVFRQAAGARRSCRDSDGSVLTAAGRNGRADRSRGEGAVHHVDIYKAAFRPIKATLSGSLSRVLMKLIVDGTSDRVLGCHIVGPDAAEIVQAVAIAIKMKATKADFDATMALHPTSAEELVTMRAPTHVTSARRRNNCPKSIPIRCARR